MKPLAELVTPAKKTAVIVVDVQNDFCHPDGACAKGGADTSSALAMIPRLAKFLDAAREAGSKVIFIRKVHEDCTDSEPWLARTDGRPGKTCRSGTWGTEFTGLIPAEGDPIVHSHRYSAFVNTRLDSVLRTFKIETLIMAGVATNVCVESTARHGYMLDYNVVFLSDCSAAYSQAAHDMTLDNMRKHFGVVSTADEVAVAWTRAGIAVPA